MNRERQEYLAFFNRCADLIETGQQKPLMAQTLRDLGADLLTETFGIEVAPGAALDALTNALRESRLVGTYDVSEGEIAEALLPLFGALHRRATLGEASVKEFHAALPALVSTWRALAQTKPGVAVAYEHCAANLGALLEALRAPSEPKP